MADKLQDQLTDTFATFFSDVYNEEDDVLEIELTPEEQERGLKAEVVAVQRREDLHRYDQYCQDES